MPTISITEIGVFKRCRRLWDYSYNQRIAPMQEAPYFFAGRMVHKVLEEWMIEPERQVESIWAKTLAREIEFFTQRYVDTVGTKPSEAEIADTMLKAEMPFHMVVNYRERWNAPLPDGYKLIQAEQTCIVDIPQLQGVSLEGTLDGFVLDEKTGLLYVLERKTYEQRPRIDVLASNEQFIGYCYILRRLFPDYELGGILYDGLWKRAVPPRAKKLEDLFFRHLLLKEQEEIDNWEEQLVNVLCDMTNEPRIYPNRVWQGCWDDSSYERLCTAESKGEDVDYIRSAYYGPKSPESWRNYESETI